MFLYDSSSNKLYTSIDENEWHIVAWAHANVVPRVRIVQGADLAQFFYTLPANTPKLVYNPSTDISWITIEHEGALNCRDL